MRTTSRNRLQDESGNATGKPVEMGRREDNKAEKRARIIAAAKDIIATQGIESCTMRYLAEVAELSPRTAYNLFESKTDILIAILLEGFEPLLQRDADEGDGLVVERMVEQLNRIPGDFGPQQEFYRGIHWAIMRSDDTQAKEQARQTVQLLVASRVAELHQCGELQTDCDTDGLTQHLSVLVPAILGMWADEQLSLEEALAHTRYAWVNSLVPCARGKALRYLRTVQAQGFPETPRRGRRVT